MFVSSLQGFQAVQVLGSCEGICHAPLPTPTHTHTHLHSNHSIPVVPVLYGGGLRDIVLDKNNEKSQEKV